MAKEAAPPQVGEIDIDSGVALLGPQLGQGVACRRLTVNHHLDIVFFPKGLKDVLLQAFSEHASPVGNNEAFRVPPLPS